jgi:UDP-N-acetylglucosamine--N-acetylmuramyl-(pentapeptide) pyrophosphoryl-undecaprenol N-acetylglucosamine transferase
VKVFLVAGGTGGHIFPAVAFGEWLNIEKNISSVHYVCGNRPLELEIYRYSGIEPIILPMEGSPFGISGFFKKIKRSYNILKSCVYMYSLVRREKPDVCFMFGGYVSFPALVACSVARIPIVMHEQNAVIGRVVRFAKKLGVTTVKSWDNEVTSNIPVRQFILWERMRAFLKLGISNHWFNSKIIGIFGGSLTSKSLSSVLDAIAKSFPDVLFLVLAEEEETRTPNVLYTGRQWDMNPVFSIVDLVISRGGASTLAELEAYNIPSIVVPWEKSSDNHQVANALKYSKITDNYVWRENQDKAELIRLISLSLSKQNERIAGFHYKASINLFQIYEEKSKAGENKCEQ